jgi:hypothetical protein
VKKNVKRYSYIGGAEAAKAGRVEERKVNKDKS